MFFKKRESSSNGRKTRSLKLEILENRLVLSANVATPVSAMSSDFQDNADALVAAWEIENLSNEINLNWEDNDTPQFTCDREENLSLAMAWEEPEIRALEIDDELCSYLNEISSLDNYSDGSSSNTFLVNSSGGSDGSGGSGGSSSGGSGENAFVTAYLSGGTGPRYEGEDIYISFSGLPVDYTISATIIQGAPWINYRESSLVVTGISSGNIYIKTVDDLLKGGDKLLTIQLDLSGSGQISSSSFTISIYERPEFLSDVDIGIGNVPYNDDSYRTYVSSDAASGTQITLRDGVSIHSKGGSGIQYGVTVQLSEQEEAVEECFTIEVKENEDKEKIVIISLSLDAEECIKRLKSDQCNLTIWAYESRCVPGYSSGGVWCDSASVKISFSHWNVDRQCLQTASVSPIDGCTVAMLAKDIGLSVSDFSYWLTFTPEVEAYLFDGTTKLWSQVQPDDVLATHTYTSLAVPNTIVMAWFGECRFLGKFWMNWYSNKTDLEDLGFYVEVFDNDRYSDNEGSMAKNSFLSTIWSNSYNKRLHGLYMMGHGSVVSIGSDGSNSGIGGPEWSVNYLSDNRTEEDFWDWNSSIDDRKLDTIQSALLYHMGALIIHGCYGDNANASKLVTSEESGGIFWGWQGIYNPITSGHDHDPIAKNWGAEIVDTSVSIEWNESLEEMTVNTSYSIGGAQRTKKIIRSYDFRLVED